MILNLLTLFIFTFLPIVLTSIDAIDDFFLIMRHPEIETVDEQHIDPSCEKGYMKCQENEECHCQRHCGYNFKEVFVRDDIILAKNLQIPMKSRYCLPNTVDSTGIPTVQIMQNPDGTFYKKCKYPWLFDGPECTEQVACRNSLAIQPFKNYIIDNRTIKRVSYMNVDDRDGYECVCNSETLTGQKLIPIGLACMVDECVANTFHSLAPGYDRLKNECNCGDYTTTHLQKNIWGICSPCKETDSGNPRYASAVCSTEHDLMHFAPPCKTFFNPLIKCTEISFKQK